MPEFKLLRKSRVFEGGLVLYTYAKMDGDKETSERGYRYGHPNGLTAMRSTPEEARSEIPESGS